MTPLRPRPLVLPWSALLCAAWVISFFHSVLTPATALANRDIPFFHLPLRLSLQTLSLRGAPTWDPWLHGGQPILSNPNYAAFYPPTWLCLIVSPAYSISLLAMGHMALAFYGALRLARRLGCGTSASLLAALSFSGGGALLSLLNAFNGFCTVAWLPWVLKLALDLAEPPPESSRPWPLRAFWLGLVLALQFLAGEPVYALTAGIALLAVVVVALRRRTRVLVPFLVAGALTLLLAAIQLLPTFGRLAGSPRGAGVGEKEATSWSMAPVRMAEMIFPRIFGDSGRIEAGRYFGWKVNDRYFPYVVSLYSGLLLALVGAAALLRGPAPWRPAWILMILASLFLAMGRFNPLYLWVREHLPVLSVVRYPEKFICLAVAAMGFAGSLGWQRLLVERENGRREGADFPLALAAITFLSAFGLTLTATLQPALPLWYARTYGSPPVIGSADRLLEARYLVWQGWMAVAATASVVGLLVLVRFSRVPRRVIAALAVAFTAFDLWYYGRYVVKSLPIQVYTEPPVLARLIGPARDRIYVQEVAPGEDDVLRLVQNSETGITLGAMTRLEPYSGLLWRHPYALGQDYDLMHTKWARQAFTTLIEAGGDRDLGLRFMGAWNIGTIILRKPKEVWARQLLKDPNILPVGYAKNPYVLERFRFVPIANFHRSAREALTLAREQGYSLDRREHLVRPEAPPAVVGFRLPPRVMSFDDRVSRIGLRYAAEKGACFVLAITYDPNWRAVVDGVPMRIYPTAASQMALLLPAGDHQLRLEYRDPLVTYGAALSLSTLLAGAVYSLSLVRRRRLAERALGQPAA